MRNNSAVCVDGARVLVNSISSRQVFTIRRIICEKILDRNEGLWREVDALEDILREANASGAGGEANMLPYRLLTKTTSLSLHPLSV